MKQTWLFFVGIVLAASLGPLSASTLSASVHYPLAEHYGWHWGHDRDHCGQHEGHHEHHHEHHGGHH